MGARKPQNGSGAHRRASSSSDKVIDIDQSPIGRTPRSNPATYTGLFTTSASSSPSYPSRRCAATGPGRFSFNVKGGRCEECSGDGSSRSRCTSCPTCTSPATPATASATTATPSRSPSRGARSRRSSTMTVDEALEVLGAIPAIRTRLETLKRGRARLRPPRSAGDHALRRRGAAREAGDESSPSARPGARCTSSTSRPPACTSTTSASCSRC
jgi:excinuclease UvrABC ATPase subunit